MKCWSYINLNYATFAIDLDRGIVTAAPPIAQWMVGKREEEIKNWVSKKKGFYQRWQSLPFSREGKEARDD